MTPEQIRILAGIKPVPPKSQMPPPVMEPVKAQMDKADLQRHAGIKVTESATAPKPAPVEKPVAEAYAEGNHFDADMDQVRAHIKAATKIMESASMRKHIKDTHDNYGVQAQQHANMIVKALEMAEHNVDTFYDKMGEAE
jgi:hypothetical protein